MPFAIVPPGATFWAWGSVLLGLTVGISATLVWLGVVAWRNRARGVRARWPFVVTGVLLCLWSGFAFRFWGSVGRGFDFRTHTSASFETAKWRSASGSPFSDCTRLHMADDLLEDHPLIGLDAGAVTDLLGDPDDDPYLLVEQPRHRGAHIYRLGPDHMHLDSMWLVVSWGEDGRVASANVVSD